MSSSTSSSDWRRFFALAAGTAALAVVVIYAFVVLVDPFDALPLSPPADRLPVATNARFSFPGLARKAKFDSAIFGNSTSRLLQPALLNQEFDARFVNLAMNDATPYEQAQLMQVFHAAHPDARMIVVGVDIRYCVTGATDERFTVRAFPAWMYQASRWRGYSEMFNLYAVQEAGQQFGILIGIKRPFYGADGYTDFLPPDSEYDPARVQMHLREIGPFKPGGDRSGDPSGWQYPALDRLETTLGEFASQTRKLLFFVPYNQSKMPTDRDGIAVWRECKRRVATLARHTPNTLAVDFMQPSPITTNDDNYWDGMHYRVAIGIRLVHDLAAAARSETSEDYRLLGRDAESAQR